MTATPESTTPQESPAETLPILFQDEHFVAVNKPSGLLVHRSMVDRHETRFALQIVRDQIGQYVYPLHRLDKPTSGVLLFALSPEAAERAGSLFSGHHIHKTYHCITRGFTPDSGSIDHPLKEKHDRKTDRRARRDKPAQEALTHYRRLATIALPYSVDRYPEVRYSLVEATPVTGRKHQSRRHMKHSAHPLIGDAKHGKGNHNRFFAEQFDCSRLLLACTRMTLEHPFTQQPLQLAAPLDHDFWQVLEQFQWQNLLSELHPGE